MNLDKASRPICAPRTRPVHYLEEVHLPGLLDAQTVQFCSSTGTIESIERHPPPYPATEDPRYQPFETTGLLAIPSLCHPHVHLDKPYLLTHSSTLHLQPATGSFQEALSLTAAAKALYSYDTLVERMNLLLANSSRAGVTHIRGFAEVDSTVKMTALDAALEAQNAWKDCMSLQVCAFAQDPVFSGENGDTNRALMEAAVQRPGVEVLGSTPYVESDHSNARSNVEWAVRTAIATGIHLDLHLDYNVDAETGALIWWVLEVLKRENWAKRMPNKTVCLGHCTRLTLFTAKEWARLREEIGALPIYFVGLPTSDLFMMGRRSKPNSNDPEVQNFAALADRKRCTLQVPAMIAAGFHACIGINNIGNAFTPYGTADPLALAQWCVGLYQCGTREDAEVLFECISSRAKEAIGVYAGWSSAKHPGAQFEDLAVGKCATLVLVGEPSGADAWEFRRRTNVCEAIWDAGLSRKTIYRGKWVQI